MKNESLTGKYYFYVKVIEAEELTPNHSLHTLEPFVTIKLNGHDHLHKKSTKYHSGVQWWEQTFRFRVKNLEYDWILVEVREKGSHLFGSNWIGELELQIKQFSDGKIHENWFQLGKGSSKEHYPNPRGYLRLSFHLVHSKYIRPFEGELATPSLTFQEWKESGMSMPGLKAFDSSGDEAHSTESLNSTEIRNILSMQEAEKEISRNASKILVSTQPNQEELLHMKKYNRVNCLHRGNFENCKGKRYMVAIDGTESSRAAFESCLPLVGPEDHLFIVTVRERRIPYEFPDERSRIIITHKLWQAACDIIRFYQEKLTKLNMDYTSILPEADDPRDIICALVKKYKVDTLILAKHKGAEKRGYKHHFQTLQLRSFKTYCQRYANCSVIVV